MTTEPIRLSGLDGSNPLAFLAAVGTLRLLSAIPAAGSVRMSWNESETWQPELTGITSPPAAIAKMLAENPSAPIKQLLANIGPNLTVTPEAFAPVTEAAAHAGDRSLADFLAAFGCETIDDGKRKNPRIRYTDLCFITGSGHQDFLKTADKLRDNVSADDLQAALFTPWSRKNLKGMSFRWDPEDAAEYALQWSDPSRQGAATVPGANWLAFEALPAFPTQPVTTQPPLRTTAFSPGGHGQAHQFRWPLWKRPTTYDTLRSLLASPALAATDPTDADIDDLIARGVTRIYSAARVRIGQGANFKVSFRPPAALA